MLFYQYSPPVLIFAFYLTIKVVSVSTCADLHKEHIDPCNRSCWGYETDCGFDVQRRYQYRNAYDLCPQQSSWFVSKKDARKEQAVFFYRTADFGYVRRRLDELHTVCRGRDSSSTYLVCSDHMRFCSGRKIFISFSNLEVSGAKKYRQGVLQKGDIGGTGCDLDSAWVDKHSDHLGFLMSWADELRQFTVLEKFKMSNCDVVFDKPVMIVKLDAGTSMYHHFCDFVNLFVSQHINNGSFSTDIKILIWETSAHPYYDLFKEMWSIFSRYPLLEINQFNMQKLCFHHVTFPLLARMRFGLYYNMPLVSGCSGSALFHAFNRHALHRLGVSVHRSEHVRVTFLSRTTSHRRIVNENELFKALQALDDVQSSLVNFESKSLPFIEQVKISANSDIFIGIHGSGLTHALFLPDWAVLFELYNCDDPNCYLDLARLRGVEYITWEKKELLQSHGTGRHPSTGGEHAKFKNYSFDVDEFLRLVRKAVAHVQLKRAKVSAGIRDEL